MRRRPGHRGPLGGEPVRRAPGREVLHALVARVAASVLKPYTSKVFDLDRAGEALRLVERGHALGKVVIAVTG